MRKHLSIVAAAAMSVAIAGVNSVSAEDAVKSDQKVMQNEQYGNQGGQAQYQLKHPAGVKAADITAEDLYEELGQLTGELISDDFEGMVDHFVDQDRNRLDDFEGQDMPKLSEAVKTLQQKWQERYNEKLTMDGGDVENIFADAKTIGGEIEDPNALLAQWPMNPVPEGVSGEPVKASVQQPLTEELRTQGNIEKGREIGVVYLPGKNNLPAVQASFIDEAFGWKLDVPNDRTGQQIHDSLVQHLSQITQHMDKLPQDKLQAKRLLSHHVLMALYGVDTKGGAQEINQPNLNGPQNLDDQNLDIQEDQGFDD